MSDESEKIKRKEEKEWHPSQVSRKRADEEEAGERKRGERRDRGAHEY